MAYGLVGSVGAIVTNTTTATVSPTFAQATTAGSLLVCRLVSLFGLSGSWSTTSPGWTIVQNNAQGAAIAYKPNCGASETAPTFTWGSTVGGLWADLTEYSGAATSSPVDQQAFPPATASPDASAGSLAVYAQGFSNSKSATYTFTDSWTPAGGTVVAAHGTGATKSTTAAWFSAYITSSNASGDDDSVTVTPSTGSQLGGTSALVSFKPASTQAVIHRPIVIAQAVSRASNW